jgi:hypothetical protein
MTVEDLRQALRRQPFQPFRLRMRNGDVYDLPEVGRMALSPIDTDAVVYIGDVFRFINPQEVVAMEPLEAQSWTTE